jgi:hypothetical protein
LLSVRRKPTSGRIGCGNLRFASNILRCFFLSEQKTLKPGTFLDHNMDEIPFSDFINKELILFSMADNIRSIPSVADGLKPGQRKVIWGCFKRKLNKEIKVSCWRYLADKFSCSCGLNRLHNLSVIFLSMLHITTEKQV